MMVHPSRHLLPFLMTPVCGLLLACADDPPHLSEASGVCRQGDYLLIVGDEGNAGFRIAIGDFLPPLISLDHRSLEVVPIPHPELTDDLESIDVLADGRVVALSESGYSLASAADGLVVQYDETLSPVSGRGLEGLAARPADAGGSWIAVVWEGGYPRPDKSLPRGGVDDYFSMLPLLVVHELGAGEKGMIHTLADAPALPLRVHTPKGEEPEAPRFRAPDLVWHRMPDGSWGFIVLLSSENLAGDPRSRLRCLQRFDRNGAPVGDPLDIEKLLPDTMQDLNWEGLGWFDPGKSLVTVYDADAGTRSHAFVIDLPEGW